MRVLLVDDDTRFAGALTAALRRCGYEVDRAEDIDIYPPWGR